MIFLFININRNKLYNLINLLINDVLIKVKYGQLLFLYIIISLIIYKNRNWFYKFYLYHVNF